jgi:hypothetical protein
MVMDGVLTAKRCSDFRLEEDRSSGMACENHKGAGYEEHIEHLIEDYIEHLSPQRKLECDTRANDDF